MLIGILVGRDIELEYQYARVFSSDHKMFGIAITWWKRDYAKWWHVGVRFTLLLKKQHGFRICTYACPRLNTNGVPTSSNCILPPE